MKESSAKRYYNEAKAYLSKGGSTTFSDLDNHSFITEIRLTSGPIKDGGQFKTGVAEFSIGDANNNNKHDQGEQIYGVRRENPEFNGTITWNPFLELVDMDGAALHSPALVLEHEGGHALHALLNLLQYFKDLNDLKTDGTTNTEERKAIARTNVISKNLKNGDVGIW